MLEVGPRLADFQLLAQNANGLQLLIDVSNLLVQCYVTKLTDKSACYLPIVRGVMVGGSGAVSGGYFCRELPYDFDPVATPDWGCSYVRDRFRAIEKDLDFDGPAQDNTGFLLVQLTREIAGVIEIFPAATQCVEFLCIVNLNDVGDYTCFQLSERFHSTLLTVCAPVPLPSMLITTLRRLNLTLLAQKWELLLLFSDAIAAAVNPVGLDGSIALVAD
nr:hypothetical protein [Mycobacterium leprae]